MEWIMLQSEQQFNEVMEKSKERSQVIYKHSSRCNLSSIIKDSLENEECSPHADFYFLDVVSNRALSRRIAKDLHVHHESPQVILIREGRCVYEESHFGIRMEEICRQVEKWEQAVVISQ
jgi:bacillithiol system protein YtxJ